MYIIDNFVMLELPVQAFIFNSKCNMGALKFGLSVKLDMQLPQTAGGCVSSTIRLLRFFRTTWKPFTGSLKYRLCIILMLVLLHDLQRKRFGKSYRVSFRRSLGTIKRCSIRYLLRRMTCHLKIVPHKQRFYSL
jgi:hypothetical protein